MALRMGELLIRRGRMTPEQVERVLERQRTRGGAFGQIAERMFDIHPSQVEAAWAQQHADITQALDLSTDDADPRALSIIDARQAWQFRVLPLRVEPNGEAVLCTTRSNLPRALRFTYSALDVPACFVLASEDALQAALERRYPFPGMDAFGATFESLLASGSKRVGR